MMLSRAWPRAARRSGATQTGLASGPRWRRRRVARSSAWSERPPLFATAATMPHTLLRHGTEQAVDGPAGVRRVDLDRDIHQVTGPGGRVHRHRESRRPRLLAQDDVLALLRGLVEWIDECVKNRLADQGEAEADGVHFQRRVLRIGADRLVETAGGLPVHAGLCGRKAADEVERRDDVAGGA